MKTLSADVISVILLYLSTAWWYINWETTSESKSAIYYYYEP